MRTLITLLFLTFVFNLSTAQVYVNVNATGNNDGTSWTDAYNNLQTALDSSDALSQLWVAAGTYTPEPGPTPDSTHFIAIQSIEIYGGFNGTETMLEERDWVTNPTILSGDIGGDDIPGDFVTNRDDNARNVIITTGAFYPFVVDGVSIVNGHGRLDDFPMGTTDFRPWFGGGILTIGNTRIRNCIFSENSGYIGSALSASFGATNDFKIDNCTFSNNFSIYGAVRIQSSLGALVSNCTFSNNIAEIFGAAVVAGNSSMIVEDCDFSGNASMDGIGGGLFIFQNAFNPFDSPTVEVRRCNFVENRAPRGSGIGFNNFFPESSIVIDSCNFSDNIAPQGTGGYGAGITLQNYPDNISGGLPSLAADIQNSTIDGNTAEFAPGLYFASFSDVSNLSVDNCLFDGNIAENDFGAVGVFNYDAFIDVDFTGVDFENNKSEGVAGALAFYNDNDDGPMEYTLDSCVFDNNIAVEAGGAIWSSGAPGSTFGSGGEIRNTVFIENAASECCGAIASINESLSIVQSSFIDNSTEATGSELNGGGAIAIATGQDVYIQQSIFEGNESDDQGAAIMIVGEEEGRVFIENSILTENTGNSTILNTDSLWMTNVTMIDNERGLAQASGGYAYSQNTIHSSELGNYENPDSSATIVSLGGNLSSDNSLTEFFIGFGPYADFNNASSELDLNFVPTEISPCVDAGNPDGVTALVDYAGVERFQGVTLDIGALESAFDTPVRELNALKINVFPNPFTSTLQFSSLEGVEQINLLDGLGKHVQILPVEKIISVNSDLATGVYYLEVLINGRVYFKKLTKK